ncbi:MAG TPA: molecular chaperone HtpG [Blastocatellia bacterium]|nr:molecular chaperone HtpG [Blastocatellia bacterium]
MMNYAEEFQFQAETAQLLDLMIHSLYTNKEIFLRELISNASDALDRLRFEALTDPRLLDGDDRYEIRLIPDPAARTLTIADTGIGMSRQEVIDNIGTIAKSGTRELREAFREGASQQVVGELIGQFGVGFYSAFMVAEKVTLCTRRAGEATATLWESTGDGSYNLTDAQRQGRGTEITLHLKPASSDEGLEDFTDQWVLARIVRRYSDFVSYPIICPFESEKPGEPGAPLETVVEDKTLNSMQPIWARAPGEISEGEYTDFYRHITNDWEEPLQIIASRAEGTAEYQALLFIPSKAPTDLFYHAAGIEIRLYAKRVLIMERCDDLLPKYLRFIKGVVDSSDLPLNISRQMLQQDRHIAQIRKWLTRKVLDTLETMREKDPGKYLKFWREFGRALKEGISADHENKERLLRLALFSSSHDAEELTTLADYVERMKPEQEDIYYLTGESRALVENSPHLEGFRERGYEVLYLIDPVDELLTQAVWEYAGKRLKSAGKGMAKLGSAQDRERIEQELKAKEEATAEMLAAMQKAVDEHVKQVRLTSRLVASPACLVGNEMDYSPQLEKLLLKGKGGGAKQRRILELNPEHELFKKLHERYAQRPDEKQLGECAELLLGYALLAEGSELPDPVRFNQLVIDSMVRTL